MQGKYIRSVHTELLAIALALVIMAKNEYSTHFFGITIAKSSLWPEPWVCILLQNFNN